VSGRYVVTVAENSRYLDPDARWTRGSYVTAEEALAECRRMVDDDLAELYRPGMTAEQLIAGYRASGRDPFIIPRGGAEFVAFSGWTHAEQRAAALCGEERAASAEAVAPARTRFLQLHARYPIILRVVAGEPTTFWNRRTLAWCRFAGKVPDAACEIPLAEVWRWIGNDYRGLDFGRLY